LHFPTVTQWFNRRSDRQLEEGFSIAVPSVARRSDFNLFLSKLAHEEQTMRTVIGLSIVLSVAFAARGADVKIDKPADTTFAAQASNAFACDLFKKLDESQRGKNVFFSPYSISSALAMALEGARGDTAREMGDVLRLPASLGAKVAAEPWRTGPYSLGFGSLDRQWTADPAKTKIARQQLADMNKQLADLNRQIEIQSNKRDFRTAEALSEKAFRLADAINALAKQVDPYELKVANALWGEKTYPFRKDYLGRVDQSFGSGHLRSADFINNYPGERVTINRWIEEQTNNRIKDLLPELPPKEARLLRLVLVNAIYFKGEWSIPFREESTAKADFHLAEGGGVPVSMMNLWHGGAAYAAFEKDGSFFATPTSVPEGGEQPKTYPASDGFTVAELPIKGNRLAMVVIAPRSPGGLPAVEAKLSGESLSAWLGKLQSRTVRIALPRFKLESTYSLEDALRSLGMNQAFGDSADFTAMSSSPDRLRVSKVLHKAFVEVNEKGAEAAAATVVMSPKKDIAKRVVAFTPEFRADRPFLFLIRDRDSGVILFLGRMTRPA
jgi:serpin B